MLTRHGNLGMLWAIAAIAALSSGCLERPLKPLNPCLISGVAQEISVTNVDKVDLLFVVDNSQSMAQEQVALRAQFPKLVTTLATGMLANADGSVKTFPPVGNLNLGVVSVDMGLVGIQGVQSCEGLGDNGELQHTGSPDVPGCNTAPNGYPEFLTFREDVDDPTTVANEFACIASLGTDGCGFEQQLEAGLKALWPALDIDPMTGQQWVNPNTNMPDNRITFVSLPDGTGKFGNGNGLNDGFLRNNPNFGVSLIAVVVVTDEEDCSSSNTAHFTPSQFLPPDSPYKNQAINLRCYYQKMAGDNSALYSTDRYVNGLRALRPGQENLVVFGAITGVPPDLVKLRDDQGNALVDLQDDAMREQWYSKILSDVRMQERIDTSEPDEAKRNLVPSCGNPGEGSTSLAYPPRRIVEVAQKFGANGIVQSICQDDFSGAMDAIIDIISNQLGAVCLPRLLVPNSEGVVGCDVLWELPAPGAPAPMETPRSCDDLPFLSRPEMGKAQQTPEGGAICVVKQLPVTSDIRGPAKSGDDAAKERAKQAVVAASGNGWFYDDFSKEVADQCPETQPQRITFTDDAKPETGVTVKLECLSQLQSLPKDYPGLNLSMYQDGNVPISGTPCSDGATQPERDKLCFVAVAANSDNDQGKNGDTTAGNGFDERMFCHPEEQRCVRRCSGDAQCPPAWVCEPRGDQVAAAGGTRFCVNPTCGD